MLMGLYQSTSGQTYSAEDIDKIAKSCPKILDFVPIKMIIGVSNRTYNCNYAYGPKYWIVSSGGNNVRSFLQKNNSLNRN